MIVDLPAPVAPTMPTRSPGRTSNDTSRSTLVLAVVGERHVVEDDVAARAVRTAARDRRRRTERLRSGARIPDPDVESGDSILTGVSSSLKMRSDEAIAACRTLNFSDMSLIGRKKRCEYCRNATSAPSVSVPCSVQPPPNQMMSAAASAPITSIAG